MNTKLIRLRRALFGAGSFFFRHFPFFLLVLLLSGLVFAGFKTKSLLREVGLEKLNFLTFFKNPEEILETTNGRTNFLLLGIRGEGSDSPDLTDTLLVASYSHKDKEFTLISIPRDLWVSSLKTKINSVYHYGKFREPKGGGIKLAQSSILETLGLPIHYTAVINFKVFKEVIDLVGGVEIDVERSFTDRRFPIEGRENALPIESRYETVTFTAGPQLMNGETALKFVRSRQAEGEEGTDIARDRRQQLVISALKQKITDPAFLLNKEKLVSLYHLATANLETNLSEDLYPALARIAFDARRRPAGSIILSYETEGEDIAILENPPISPFYLNQWVLIARDGNWPALQQYIQNKLENRQ